MRISDWSSDVCSSDLLAPKVGIGSRKHASAQNPDLAGRQRTQTHHCFKQRGFARTAGPHERNMLVVCNVHRSIAQNGAPASGRVHGQSVYAYRRRARRAIRRIARFAALRGVVTNVMSGTLTDIATGPGSEGE